MADEANLQLESVLNTLINITDRSGNLQKDLKRDISESVSTLRDIFVNLKNCAVEHIKKIALLESEFKKTKAELQENRAVKLSARVLPSMEGIGNIPAPSVKQVQPSLGGARNLYSDVISEKFEKRYKIMVKSRTNESTETIKNFLKANIHPTTMKVGIKTLKSLRDGIVLIEVGTMKETNLLCTNFSDKCGEEVEVAAPKLRIPRLIIRNTPQDITAENLEETILAQNPELSLKPGEVTARFKFTTKRGETNMVIEVGPETRKKMLKTKLKIGWLIFNIGDYLVARRC